MNLLTLKRYQDEWRNWHPQGPNTAPVSLYVALNTALDRIIKEGLKERIGRHKKVTTALREAVQEIGFELFVEDSVASKTVTSIKLPQGLDGEELRKIIADDFNILLGGGLGETKNSVIRIGHMGMTASSEFILPTLNAIELASSRLGFKVKEGKAQEKFKKVMG